MILLTGGSGQVGRSLLFQQAVLPLPCVAPSSRDLDLAYPQSIAHYLQSNTLSAIINAGAYTAVDQAESNPDRAKAINADAPEMLADYCKVHDIPLIHISTDYVFAGDKKTPYNEQDETDPLGVYGQTKLAGEQAILSSGCRAVILRTAWVVSPFGKNFIKTMFRLADMREEISVVADQKGCPTGAQDLAGAVLGIASRLIRNKDCPIGLYHCTNQGETTWADLARFVMTESAHLNGPSVIIRNITTTEYPTPARRPLNSRLSCIKLKEDFAIEMRPWQDMVKEVVSAILNDERQAL
jgi:dTDP-4-dehydrorhamnose reductase